MNVYEYIADQELPAISLAWYEGVTNTIIDFSTGWTATVKVCLATTPTAIALTKTAGITLAATSPNYVIDWAVADLTTLATAAGSSGALFTVYPYCRRNSDSKDRAFAPLSMRINPAPA